ncbi:hypothetical protein BC941DRAFT_195222 [Chlamydoabsidia padenii]|nr:hypothetical protein BC941DRAFT_195222 [Chlamydoabsidia padenii]
MFMGTGTAIICKRRNTFREDGTTTFQPLTHKIPYLDTLDSFHAVWANMPTWCRYCHEERHTKYDCAGLLASMTCHYCKEQGHRAANCPKKTPLVSQIQEESISVSQAPNSTNPFQTLEDQSAFEDSLGTNSTTITTTPTEYSTGDKRPAMIDESDAESTMEFTDDQNLHQEEDISLEQQSTKDIDQDMATYQEDALQDDTDIPALSSNNNILTSPSITPRRNKTHPTLNSSTESTAIRTSSGRIVRQPTRLE